MSELGRPRGAELMSLAAHQLRTPLAVIAGHAELIGMRTEQASVREEARYITEAVAQLGRAVDGLLALFALDSARIPDEPRAIPLADVLNGAFAFSPALRGRVPHLPEEGLRQVVHGDPTRLAQALAAVLASGYAGLPAELELTLDVEERRGVAMLSVGSGAATGWPTGDAARLGLYVATRLVESEGASLFVREQSGSVSSVVMMLPTPVQGTASRHWSVLIVDDDDTMRRLLRATLPESEGFAIVEAGDGKQAFELLERDEPIDLVLLDWMMPERSGAEVLEQIRSRHPEVPVIVLTAELEPRQRELAESLGADIFLTKPFSPLQLLEHVERLLPGRSG